MELIIDKEFETLIPALTEEELKGLEKSIKEEGCKHAIEIWNNVIVDGHNRYKICKKNKIEFEIIKKEFDNKNEAKIWIIDNQFNRRNLSAYQRCVLVSHLEDIFKARAKENQKLSEGRGKKGLQISANLNPVDTRQELAKRAGVSHDTIMKVKKIESQASPEIKNQLIKNETSINKAYTTIIREEKEKQNEALKKIQPEKLKGLYDVIVIDPPWPMQKIERDIAPNQSKNLDYPTMTIEEIKKIKLPTTENCHLWLWTTHKFLPNSFEILKEWNLKYVCCFVWHKNGGFQPFNLPQYNCEFVLYARKGTPAFIDTKAFNVCFDADRKKHSEKPQQFYNTICRVTEGKRIDMFSRRKIEGFDSWGNES